MIDDLNLEQIEDSIMVLADEPIEEGCGDNCTLVTYLKLGFVIVCFFEGLMGGLIPTWFVSCRTNPKVFGVANSFAAGVFMAISIMHIMPEMIEGWTNYIQTEKVFPLPEALCLGGYTLILVLDKVLFDTHSLFDDHGHEHPDPAEIKFQKNLKESLTIARNLPADANEE